MIVSLIGYRATGKTTVGHLLSERLGWSFVDTDEQIQQDVGKSIRQIFELDGEDVFRQYETQVIRRLVRRHKLVLSLGGGAVLLPENRQLIGGAGPVIWLTAQPATIRARLLDDPQTQFTRPTLTSGSAAEEVERVLAERMPIYEACADRTVAVDTRTPREIVDTIMAELELLPEKP